MLDKVRLLEFPLIKDGRGNLSFVENLNHIPFEIRRVFYLYDVPEESSRGGHCHKVQNQVLIALNGSLEIVLQDGFNHQTYILDKPHVGLYVPNLIWSDLIKFSEGTVCLALTSDLYDEEDYIRDYEEFLLAVQGSGNA